MIGKEPLSTILYPFSLLYGVASSVKNHLYDTGVLSQYTTSIPVICVGNITVGGSGKSPVVQMIVSKLLSQGKRPVILSRGYGGSERGPIEVKEEHLASAVGDEPLMHKKHFRQTVSVVVARKRAHGAQFIEEKSLGDIIVLDDGYQHRALNRAVNILLIDRSSKEKEHLWRKKRFLPSGPFRESIEEGVKRAQLIIEIERFGLEPFDKPTIASSAEKVSVKLSQTGVKDLVTNEVLTFSSIGQRPLIGMAALADPEQFFKGLTKLGVSLKEQRSFPDHYADFEKEVFKELSGGKSVVMTEKDAAKVSTKSYNKGQIFVVSFEAKASSEKDDAVINRVVSQL